MGAQFVFVGADGVHIWYVLGIGGRAVVQLRDGDGGLMGCCCVEVGWTRRSHPIWRLGSPAVAAAYCRVADVVRALFVLIV